MVIWLGREYLDECYQVHKNVFDNVWLNIILCGLFSILLYTLYAKNLFFSITLIIINALFDGVIILKNKK